MKPVYLKRGQQLLPGRMDVVSVLEGRRVVSSPIDYRRCQGLVETAAYLEDNDLKAYGAGRIVRKTSDRQSRWVIAAAIDTWAAHINTRSYNADAARGTTGLFLGLGTIDCEDEDAPIGFDGTLADYAAKMLSETKPTAGLALLNSTTASHIAQLTKITGVNSVFSPFADAGAQAIIEACSNIQEGYCSSALIAAGGQKITPWYFLVHREFIAQWTWPGAFPAESAAALVASDHNAGADARILACRRAFASPAMCGFPSLEEFLAQSACHNISVPDEVIYTGGFQLTQPKQALIESYLPDAKLCLLDQFTGYTGAVGALHAAHLATEMVQQCQIRTGMRTNDFRKPRSSETVLVIAEGYYGQVCYLIIGKIDD